MSILVLRYNIPDGDFCTVAHSNPENETFEHCPFRSPTKIIGDEVQVYCRAFATFVQQYKLDEENTAERFPRKCDKCLASIEPYVISEKSRCFFE